MYLLPELSKSGLFGHFFDEAIRLYENVWKCIVKLERSILLTHAIV